MGAHRLVLMDKKPTGRGGDSEPACQAEQVARQAIGNAGL